MEVPEFPAYHQLINKISFPLEVLKTDFEKAKTDPRCGVHDVLDDNKWPTNTQLLRLACIAVLLSRMNGYRTREDIRYSHGFYGQNVVMIVEQNYN